MDRRDKFEIGFLWRENTGDAAAAAGADSDSLCRGKKWHPYNGRARTRCKANLSPS